MADTKKQTEAEVNAQAKRSELKSKCKAAGKAYEKMLDPLKIDKVPFEYRQSARMQFLHEYKDVVEDYLEDQELSKESISSDFDNVVKLYKSVYNGQKPKEDRDEQLGKLSQARKGSANIIYTSMRRNGLSVNEEVTAEEMQSDSQLTGAQRTGLKDISQWMLRNMDKTGLTGDSKAPYVRGCVLKQPARVKLCAYYLVEKDARKLSGEALQKAVAESQSPSYVPNLARFKDKMIASKFKFWKRFTGDQFYWHKLADSMRFAMQAKPILIKFGDLGVPEVTEADATSQKDSATDKKTSNSASGAGTPSGDKSKKVENPLEKMLKHRDDALALFAKKEKNASGGPWGPEDDEKLKQAQEGFLKNSLEIIKAIQSGEVDSVATSGGKLSEKNEKIGLASTIEGAAASAISADKVTDFVKDTWSGAVAKFMENSGEWIGAANGLNSCATLIIDIVRWARKDGYTSSSAKWEEAGEFFSKLTDILKGGLESYRDIADIAKKSATGIQMTGITNIVVGGVSVITGTTKLITSGVRRTHLTDSQEAINGNKDISAADKKKTNDLIELQRRNEKLKQNQGGASMVSGTLNIIAGCVALSGLGLPLATFISGVASVISLASSVWAFFKKKANRDASIDAYIQMDKIYPPVKKQIIQTYKNRYKAGKGYVAREDQPQEDDIKKYIRLEAAANMACYGLDDFYNFITREYAELIYSKVFYKDDGATPIDYKDGKPELSETNKQYAELLKGFGLKAKYKKDKPQPTVMTIQKRMQG